MVAVAKGLGKGLSALMNDGVATPISTSKEGSETVLLRELVAGKYQPRQHFSAENLQELADSIKENGVLQPLLVRRIKNGLKDDQYEIIAGERRFRAAKIAGLERIPVIYKDIADAQALEIALIENIQREELNPLEEAVAFVRLMDEFKYTQEALAKTLGKSRSHVANILRLNQLPDSVKRHITSGKLTMGHARALIRANNIEDLAEKVIRQSLNVRQTEALAGQEKPGANKKASRKKGRGKSANILQNKNKDADILQLEQMLAGNLGLQVTINAANNKAGEVIIRYESLVELDEVLKRLGSSAF
jgi:ParB family chromosome partitioning protein